MNSYLAEVAWLTLRVLKKIVCMHNMRIFIDHVHMKERAQEQVMKHGFPSL